MAEEFIPDGMSQQDRSAAILKRGQGRARRSARTATGAGECAQPFESSWLRSRAARMVSRMVSRNFADAITCSPA